ncbi:LPXTG cell wall anchor domain-containing protein [Streptomyces sp. NPDC046465]|uniref:LPXTG cell wall anchor domain-containing protein n=1 Tax=Streptomyces sp. NPDC046465 TaxID=3155810 RepID=UPI003403A901
MRNTGHTRVPTAEASTSVLPTGQCTGLPEVFMKLRRAMAAAAATAAIAPIALLSAPAALATEGTAPTPAASDSLTPTQTPPVTPPADATPPSTPDPAATPAPPATPAKPAKPTPTKKTKKSDELPDVPDVEDPAEPAPDDCPVDEDGVDVDSELEVELVDLPTKLVPGSGWHKFELTVTNPTYEPLGEVRWTTFVDNFPGSKDKKDWLRTYAELQFLDPETDEWTTIDSKLDDGLAYGTTELDAEDEATIKLRVKIGAKAPLGKGYAIGMGKYVDSDEDCVHNSDAYQQLWIAKADSDGDNGSDNENPAPATPAASPTPSKSPSASVKKPQGGAQDAPVTDGSLAETGSGSMLPTVGLVGGLAVVAGAGVVFAVRRRKADSAV